MNSKEEEEKGLVELWVCGGCPTALPVMLYKSEGWLLWRLYKLLVLQITPTRRTVRHGGSLFWQKGGSLFWQLGQCTDWNEYHKKAYARSIKMHIYMALYITRMFGQSAYKLLYLGIYPCMSSARAPCQAQLDMQTCDDIPSSQHFETSVCIQSHRTYIIISRTHSSRQVSWFRMSMSISFAQAQ